MTKSKPIQASLIEYPCECTKGVFRYTGIFDKQASPIHFEHKCSTCGKLAMFTVVYPMISYKGKNFMLADDVRFLGEMPKPDI